MAVFALTPGSIVDCDGKQYVITNLLNLVTVLAKDIETGDSKRLFIKDLKPPPPVDLSSQNKRIDLAVVPDEDWQEAQRRFEIIRSLVNNSYKTVKQVQERANLAGVHPATIYRWLEMFEGNPRISSLIPNKGTGGRGSSRLPEKIVTLMDSTIDEIHLKRKDGKKKYVGATCEEVIRRCKNAGLQPPHPNTVRKRITVLAEKETLNKRQRRREKPDKPTSRAFPGADWPLSVVQIDHTKIDIIVVDDIDRLPVGRPWITLAICVFSRMVVGIYVSFNAPSTLSVGECIAQAVLPKENWLAKRGVTTPWPIWGKMKKVHFDNAPEFAGYTLDKACEEHGIGIDFRPLGSPNYGGHIERLCGTLLKEIHDLPGTTFSNPKERGEYNSEKHAALTLTELEIWLAELITGKYHQRKHSELETSPIKKFEEGIFGTKDNPGSGLPDKIVDEERFRLDFLPFFMRTVQDDGIVIDEIHYYAPVLSPWIDAREPKTGKKLKFVVRRDTRDISIVYFLDPELNQYFEIPYRDTSRPAISLWEAKEARRRLKEQGISEINEELIFATCEKMKAIRDEAVRKTKKERRDSQRRRDNEKAVGEFRDKLRKNSPEAEPVPVLPAKKIEPFAEIDEVE